MVKDAQFPLYVFEKDDWSMFQVENQDRIFYRIEPIDFENDEYLFWDAVGNGIRLILERGKLTKIEEVENEITLNEAFTCYSQVLGSTVNVIGAPAEVWARLHASVKPESLWSRAGCYLFELVRILVVLTVVVFLPMLIGAIVFTLLRPHMRYEAYLPYPLPFVP